MSSKRDCWFQRADISADDYPKISLTDALQIYRNIDWNREDERQETLKENSEDECPAGFAVMFGDGGILHLCETGTDIELCFLHQNTTKKILFFSWKSERVGEYSAIPKSLGIKLIQLAFQENVAELERLLKPYRRSIF